MGGIVEAVQKSGSHTLIKPEQASIRLLAGLGVEGDAHMGVTVKHRSRVARDPSQPNLRQVHLIHAELHDALRAHGFTVGAGEMGKISRRAVSTCYACRRAHACTSVRRRWSRSPACVIPVRNSNASSRVCGKRCWTAMRRASSSARQA